MPWYLNDDGNGNDGKRSERETSKKRGTTLMRRISSRSDDALDEKREKEKKGMKNVGEEEVAAGNEKKKKWKNKFKRKRRRGKEDEEEKEDDDDEKDEKRKKQKASSSLLLSKAPSVSTNWHKLVARGDIKTSEKGKRRKRDFDAPLPSRSASASARENYYDNDGNDAENECGRRGNDEDADDELRRPTPTSRDASVTETLAIDCEMVGVGEDGDEVRARSSHGRERTRECRFGYVRGNYGESDGLPNQSLGRASERFEKRAKICRRAKDGVEAHREENRRRSRIEE